MTHPPRRTPDLRVQIPEREPDENVLVRLTTLARASSEDLALSAPGPARWKVALVAASVAAIASGGAALADALAGDERPSPMSPPTQMPSEDGGNGGEKNHRSARDPEEGSPDSGRELGLDRPAEPAPDQQPAGVPDAVATHEEEGDDGDGEPDDDPTDDSDDDTRSTREGDEVREDDRDDEDEPDSRDEDDDESAGDSTGGSRD